MTKSVASAGTTRVDAIALDSIARLPWSVRAVVDDDWLIFLDVARNRYRAIKCSAAPSVAGMGEPLASAGEDGDAWRALACEGLVAAPARSGTAMLPAEQEEATFGDVCSLAFAALWARRVVRRGALLQAFGALSAAKARIVPDARSLDYARRVHARFVAARIWLPARYVCLFDSLCLMRVLLAQGVKADLVFGVRGRPFAAHCWVECESEILDEGGEACASFVEIVRV